jgi:hypothetical protein
MTARAMVLILLASSIAAWAYALADTRRPEPAPRVQAVKAWSV